MTTTPHYIYMKARLQKQFERKIDRLTSREFNKAVRQALDWGAKRTVAMARPAAPHKSGRLRKSIRKLATLPLGPTGKTRRAKRRGMIERFVVMGSRRELGIKGRWYYPAVQEYGATYSTGRVYPGKPFLRPAFKLNRRATWNRAQKNVMAAIRNVCRGGR